MVRLLAVLLMIAACASRVPGPPPVDPMPFAPVAPGQTVAETQALWEEAFGQWERALHTSLGFTLWACFADQPVWYIRGDHRLNEDVVRHELVHVEQLRRLGCNGWRQLTAAQRDSLEAEARRVSRYP